MKHLFEVWPKALTSDYCDHIVKIAKQRASFNATIGFEDNKADSKYRSSTIRWLDPYVQDADIAATIMGLVNKSNRNNFGFDIHRMNEMQFTEYHSVQDGKYDWHHDVHWENPDPYDRKLSVSVQLSNMYDYDGGRLEFFNMPSPDGVFLEKGSVIIFPSFFNHRVTPVTSGTRYSLVTWIEGPKFR